jgi:hypothetical protein
MDARDELKLYESISALADESGAWDTVISVLMDMTGTVINRDRTRGQSIYAMDPDIQAASRRVAMRWLRDRGYIGR